MVNKNSIKNNLLEFWKFLVPQKKRLINAGIFMTLNILMQLPLPLVTMFIIDSVLPKQRIDHLHVIILVLLGVIITGAVSQFMNVYFITLFRAKISFDLQVKLFERVEKLDFALFKKYKTGYLMERITRDVSSLQALFADTILAFLRDALTFLVGLILILALHPPLALISLSILPFYVYSLIFFSKRIRKKSYEMQEENAILFGFLKEALSQIYIVKAFVKEKAQTIKFIQGLKKVIKKNIEFRIITSISSIISSMIGSFGPLLILWYGGMLIIRGDLSLGKLVAFTSFLNYLFGPARRLMEMNTTIQTALASLERYFEFYRKKPQIEGRFYSPIKLSEIKGSIEFKNIYFSYNSGYLGNNILKDINIKINPGETVAIVGPSGAGKTTFINLIPRFYDPDHGEICIDGINIKNIPLHHLRKNIGLIPQDTFLFSGTIRENISFGKKDASEKDIIKAAKFACAHEFIMKLADKYETEIGEGGIKLSGGEKQRISIARVFLKDPPILIFDEATSDIDSRSESMISEALKSFFEKSTSIIIAHRLSTIIECNRIILLNKGQLVDEGNHKALYSRNELYKIIFDNQLRNIV